MPLSPTGTTPLRNYAASLLAQRALPRLTEARSAAAAKLASIEAQLAEADRSVTFWDRVAVFSDSPAEKQVAELTAEVEAARSTLAALVAQSDEAMRAVWAECPPFEIVHRIEAIVTGAIAAPFLGRDDNVTDPVIAELEAIADRILDIWAPGVEIGRVAMKLRDAEFRSACATRWRDAPRTHPTLGWAPTTAEEIAARAARVLMTEAYASAHAAVARERQEFETASAKLDAARTAAERVDDAGERVRLQRELPWLEGWLSKEGQDLVAATEAELHSIEHALGASPPLAVVAAARGSAASLRLRPAQADTHIGVHGGAYVEHRSFGKAFFLASLVPLRRAMEWAFRGIATLVTDRRGRWQPHVAPGQAAFFAELDRLHLRTKVERAVAHATMLGSLGSALKDPSRRAGWVERLAFWAEVEEDSTTRLEARVEWHRSLIRTFTQDTAATLLIAAQGFPHLRGQLLLLDLHGAIGRIHTSIASTGLFEAGKCTLQGIPGAVAAVDTLAHHLAATLGFHGSVSDLIGHVAVAIRNGYTMKVRPAPTATRYAEMVEGVAARLRQTDFASLVGEVEIASKQLAEAESSLRIGTPTASVWDLLGLANWAERRDRKRRVADHAWKLRGKVARVRELLANALTGNASAAFYYRIFGVREALLAVGARYIQGGKNRAPRCEVYGLDVVARALQAWTLDFIRAFGPIQNGSALLEQWILTQLEGEVQQAHPYRG